MLQFKFIIRKNFMETGSLLETETLSVVEVILNFNKKFNRISDIEASKLDDFAKNAKEEDVTVIINEFNQIIKNVNFMSERLKGIAVDKELLEFEIKLLDKFIIIIIIIKKPSIKSRHRKRKAAIISYLNLYGDYCCIRKAQFARHKG